ncbi:MAG: NAD(P)/FAD-dependent oxidoreductase [Schwartzia sp. (in: firmicutes)]
MMAAIGAAENGGQVTLLEKMDRVGRKLRITGKGRCNITNIAEVPEIIRHIPGNGIFLSSALRAFDNQDVIRFFETCGVATKVERGGRVFPASDHAEDVVGALTASLAARGVELRCYAPVKALLTAQGTIAGVRLKSGEEIRADAVILATGGASYPGTGSTGDGAEMAAAVGHHIVPLQPALVPLEVEEDWAKELTGLSLRNVTIGLTVDGDLQEEAFGEMLFTHFGVSGPIVLTLSRKAAMALREGAFVELFLNLKPALTPEQLEKRVQRDFAAQQKKAVKNGLRDLLPARLIPPILDLAYLPSEKPIHQITREERRRLTALLQRVPLTVLCTRPLAEAIVTMGGVETREIHPKTMESKVCPGLFLAGEVADIDGFTGGYNLQAAFSMGAAAGLWSVREEAKVR